MDLILVAILLLGAVIVGWYDTYSVQRTYADVYANRHGHIPPLIRWFIVPDPDADVEEWRRRHRNLYILAAALAATAVVIAYARPLG